MKEHLDRHGYDMTMRKVTNNIESLDVKALFHHSAIKAKTTEKKYREALYKRSLIIKE